MGGNRGREKGQNIALGAPSEGEGNGNGIEVPQRGNHRILPSDEEHYSLVNQRKMEEQAEQRRIEQEELNKVRLKQEREWEEMKRQLTEQAEVEAQERTRWEDEARRAEA